MIRLKVLFLIGACFLQCKGREPFKPAHGSLPFVVYFPSRYRGLCVGTLVSRVTVITAAVCVTSPNANVKDTRPINVVTGATYRHPRRGIRVQVTKILVPNLLKYASNNRGYLMSKSAALLLLKRKVPDVLTEIPLRPLDIDYKGEEVLSLQEECLMPGWHFFYKGDKIYPVHKFLLQRNMRVQFVNIVKKTLWCEALTIKFQKALSNLGFVGMFDKSACICVRDPDRVAQPCHGMYGAPLVCRGRGVGMMMAPDAQWTNCTGFSSVIHLFSSNYLKEFMDCVSRLFEIEEKPNWVTMKKQLYEDFKDNTYDYVPEIYDKITSSSASTDEL
ncbi:ovochymase-1-like [Spodoptera frugiperda]|uniref:Ovochymase-1-like n=1 Tax=Spodoptera frugiperda TaxID=7108 RepID=A0A9R0ETF7_SPOFR|nr:ovochymase-1-like [Spodoptera frugiperda]